MAINLLKLLENELSSDVVSKISSFVGQGPATTRTALTNAVPAVMCALHQKTSTPGGSADLFDMLQRGGFSGTAFGSPASAVGSVSGLADLAKVGGPLVASLFGRQESGVVDWLAKATGIGTSAASSLLGLVVSFVLNLIGRQVGSTGGFNAASIANLIRSQGSFLASSAPNGLARALGVSQCGEAPARAYGAATPAAVGDAGEGWLNWLLPVLGMLAFGVLLIWWFAREAESVRPTTAPPVAATTPPAATAPPPVSVGPALIKKTICAGQVLEFGENGVESMLIAFLDDVTSVVGADTRFSFDRIEFETDSAALKPSSRAQLQNIAEIMKCYPTLELKIAGHTDSKADDAYNLKLSQERADSAKAELVAIGVAPSRLAAEGYGEQFPIASNDTEEGRQRNRRTDIVVTKK